MQIHISILGSALAHGAMLAVLMLGAWEIENIEAEHATFQEFVDHTHHVALVLPEKEREEEPTPEPDSLDLATSKESERETPRKKEEERGIAEAPEQPEDKPEEVLKKPEPPAEKEPEPPLEKTPPVKEPEKTIKPLVASLEPDPDTRATTQEIADEEKPAIETAGAKVSTPGKSDEYTTGDGETSTQVGSTTKGTSDVGTERGKGIGGGVDREGLIRAYQKQVYRLVKKNTAPPRAARRARLEGTAYVIVTFDESGQILSVKLRKSSGHKVLDEDAIATVKNLRSLPKPPGELGWTRKSLTIPIRYKRS
jgi:protein TonB